MIVQATCIYCNSCIVAEGKDYDTAQKNLHNGLEARGWIYEHQVICDTCRKQDIKSYVRMRHG